MFIMSKKLFFLIEQKCLVKISNLIKIEGSHMVTVFSYIALLVGALVATLTLYIGLLKIKLI